MEIQPVLRQTPEFENSQYGQHILRSADGLPPRRDFSTVPYFWLEGIFAAQGISLTKREKPNYGPAGAVVSCEAEGNDQKLNLHVQGSPGWQVVEVNHARKALQTFGLI